jgi:F-type H+-transporting ATPase subunit c
MLISNNQQLITNNRIGGNMKKICWLSLLFASVLFAQGAAQATQQVAKAVDGKGAFFTYLTALSIVSMAVTAVGVAFAQARAAVKALEGSARQPEVAPRIMTQMLIALVFMETLAIYALLVIFLLLFVNPFVKYFI